MMTGQVRRDLAKHLPDYQILEDGKLPLEIYSWLVCNVWIPEAAARGEMTEEKLIEDFLRNEGRQTEKWPDFGEAAHISKEQS